MNKKTNDDWKRAPRLTLTNKVIQRVRVIYGLSLFYINKMIIFELLFEQTHTHTHTFSMQ